MFEKCEKFINDNSEEMPELIEKDKIAPKICSELEFCNSKIDISNITKENNFFKSGSLIKKRQIDHFTNTPCKVCLNIIKTVQQDIGNNMEKVRSYP